MSELVPQPAPDLSEKVLGFRQFTARGSALCSLSMSAPWARGVNHAQCLAGHHSAPQADCHCGFYGFHACPNWWQSRGSVGFVGAITAWGKLEVHRTGFRAEFAELVLLSADPSVPSSTSRFLALEYDVPFVALRDLAGEAARIASPVPESHWPEYEPELPESFESQLQSMSNALSMFAQSMQTVTLPSAQTGYFTRAIQESSHTLSLSDGPPKRPSALRRVLDNLYGD